MVRVLEKLGADISVTDNEGKTALMLAAENSNEAVDWWLQMITIMGDTLLDSSLLHPSH